MARPKSLIKEDVPDNVIGMVADYLAKHCGVPGCAPIFHLDDARNIIMLIVDFNKGKFNKENTEN